MTAFLLRASLLKPAAPASLSHSFCLSVSPFCLPSTFSPALRLRLSRPRRLASSAAAAADDSRRGSSAKGDVDKRKYLLDVMAIRNQGRAAGPAHTASTTGASSSAKDELQVFEEWASLKLQREGSAVEPVIQEMRASLVRRLAEASPAELSSARVTSLELPPEKDPLAGVSVRPIVVKRRSKVPENWDGPGGTVVLIDKPQGDVALAVAWRMTPIWLSVERIVLLVEILTGVSGD
jgi:hypothetical protein